MRRFILSSTVFTGSLEIIYNETGILAMLDMRGAVGITPGGVTQLKNAIPVDVQNINRLGELKGIICVEEDFFVSLADFEREYPYKRNMHLLPEIWAKMDKTSQVLAWKAAQDYRKHCERNAWYKPKIAAAWLKTREYLNDWKIL